MRKPERWKKAESVATKDIFVGSGLSGNVCGEMRVLKIPNMNPAFGMELEIHAHLWGDFKNVTTPEGAKKKATEVYREFIRREYERVCE